MRENADRTNADPDEVAPNPRRKGLPAPAPSRRCYGPAAMSHRDRVRREHFAAGAIYATVVYLTDPRAARGRSNRPGGRRRDPGGDGIGVLVRAHLRPPRPEDRDGGAAAHRHVPRDGRGPGGSARGRRLPADPSGPCDARRAGRPNRVAGGRRGRRLVTRLLRRPGSADAGVGWGRSLAIATILVVAGIGLLWLEISLH